mmetsp:Transcript_1347/g.4591  ORF Transcript_1347/g.4591 Transcript_1347/m.4591 type:complete len:270 (+) Transcript_1347:91-900(+)
MLRRRRSFATTAAVLLWATPSLGRECVFHLHIPKCAGTFFWRYLRRKFCAEAEICGRRNNLRPPPACACAVNPITTDEAVLGAMRRGEYRFVSSHALVPTKCAIVAWFREPLARVVSHHGYFRHRRHHNVTLESLFDGKPPRWASNQQWSLLLRANVAGAGRPSADDARTAEAALRDLAFVGIVEHMDAALCLFADVFHLADVCDTSGRPPPQRENVAQKPPPKLLDAALRAQLERHNRYDALLYDLAQREFRNRRRTGAGTGQTMTQD